MNDRRLRLTGVRWRRVAIGCVLGLVAAIDIAGVLVQIHLMQSRLPHDFAVYRAVTSALLAGRDIFAAAPDGHTSWYRWSPLAAYLLLPIVALGLTVWRVAHFAAVVLLRDWRLIVVVLLSWPFWADVEQGNVITFAFVAAALALQRNRPGEGVYLLLCLLMPRPLMAPVAVWILWHRPGWRVPFVVAAVAETGIVAAAGWLGPWLHVLVGSESELQNGANLGPSALIGGYWPFIGLPLAGWFTWRGRLGLASLAASPYWLLYYLLFGLLECVPSTRRLRHRLTGPRAVAVPQVPFSGPARANPTALSSPTTRDHVVDV